MPSRVACLATESKPWSPALLAVVILSDPSQGWRLVCPSAGKGPLVWICRKFLEDMHEIWSGFWRIRRIWVDGELQARTLLAERTACTQAGRQPSAGRA